MKKSNQHEINVFSCLIATLGHIWCLLPFPPPLQLHLFDYLTVVEVNDAVGIGSIVLRVGHHDDGRALLVEVGEELHTFLAIL